MKPFSSLSMKYINEPRITMSVSTVKRKTVIFRRLAHSAWVRTCDSAIYLASLRMRNTRKMRRSRITSRNCVPGIRTLRYVGIIARRSTRPKKLRAYLLGWSTLTRRRMYSMVKTMVKNHSAMRMISPYDASIEATLSSMTARTLSRISVINRMSKNLPEGVSASKITR